MEKQKEILSFLNSLAYQCPCCFLNWGNALSANYGREPHSPNNWKYLALEKKSRPVAELMWKPEEIIGAVLILFSVAFIDVLLYLSTGLTLALRIWAMVYTLILYAKGIIIPRKILFPLWFFLMWNV